MSLTQKQINLINSTLVRAEQGIEIRMNKADRYTDPIKIRTRLQTELDTLHAARLAFCRYPFSRLEVAMRVMGRQS